MPSTSEDVERTRVGYRQSVWFSLGHIEIWEDGNPEVVRNTECELSCGVQAEMKKRRLAWISEQCESQHARRFGQWSEKRRTMEQERHTCKMGRLKIKVMRPLQLVEQCEDIKGVFNITKLRIRAHWWSFAHWKTFDGMAARGDKES